MSLQELINSNKVVLIPDGYVMKGAKKYIAKNIKDYPTYDDLLKRHNEMFDVKNNLAVLCHL